MRSRLGQGGKNISFRALCDADMAAHLHRVITWAGGTVSSQEERSDGVLLHITKQDLL